MLRLAAEPHGAVAVDGLDFSIFRALMAGREARFWAAQPVVDPRLTAEEVARGAHVTRATVRVRLRHWRSSGFWKGEAVWPNPRLFVPEIAVLDIPVRHPNDILRLLEELSLVEGAISARSMINDSGRSIRFYLSAETARDLHRRAKPVKRIADTEPEAVPYWLPEPRFELSGLDWRIVQQYRRAPHATVAQIAASLGIGPRTLLARRDRLLDGNAMWWTLETDAARFSVAAVFARVEKPVDRLRVKEFFEDRLGPRWLPLADGGFGHAPGPNLDWVGGLVWVDSPAALNDLARLAYAAPGVVFSRVRVPCEFRSYDEWLDERLSMNVARVTANRRLYPSAMPMLRVDPRVPNQPLTEPRGGLDRRRPAVAQRGNSARLILED